MRKLTLLLLAFLALVGCRTRKVTTTEQRHAQKEHFIHYKDSSQRDGDSETIRVTNGKVKLCTTSTHSKSYQQADSTLYNNSYTRIKTEAKTDKYTQHKQVSKQVKSSPVRHIFWLLLLAVLVFILWKYKPFRWK